jgi:YVTN family beta-propeller protein
MTATGAPGLEGSSSGLEFLLLGPLEVRRAGSPLELGPPKQRAVLALLLLHANRVVPTARLIDELWGDAPPETARAALQVYVAGLRKAFGDGQATLHTKPPGYQLEVAADALDLDRFARLRDEARASDDPVARSALLRDALGLWRDAPLGEFDGEPFAVPAAERLDEQRLATLEERIEADLALGRHATVVAELDALVAEHPYRERFRAQLMVALYRSGRQADALAAYRDARAAFVSGLGIEPGPELKGMERAVLEQDPALDPPRVEPASPPPPTQGRTPRRRSFAVPLAIAVGLVAVIALVVIVSTRDDPRVVVPPNSVAVIDPARNAVIEAIQVGIRPGPVTTGGGAVWVGNLTDRNLTRIDARTMRPAGTVSLEGRTPTGLAFDQGIVWVAHGLLGSVSRVDAQFGNVVGVRPVTEKGPYSSAGSIAAGAGEIWAVFGDATLARLERATGAVAEKTRTDASPTGVAVGYGSVWVASTFRSSVQRFSRLSLAEVDSVTVGTRPSAIAVGFGDVWVTSAGGDLVYRIDIGNASLAAVIPVGDGPAAIAVADDAVWVANTGAGTVSRIDPSANRVVETIDVGNPPAGLAVAGNLVWVTVQAR